MNIADVAQHVHALENKVKQQADEIERLRKIEIVAKEALHEIWDGYSTGEREKEAVAKMALDEIAALQQKDNGQ